MVCPECGHIFPPSEKEDPFLHQDDIQGDGHKSLEINTWRWSKHTSVKNGKEMLKVEYFPENIKRREISEYLCVLHGGYTGMMAVKKLQSLSFKARVDLNQAPNIDILVNVLNTGVAPTDIVYKKNGRYFDVIDRIWNIDREQKRKENFLWKM
jgi:hypothetical protein